MELVKRQWTKGDIIEFENYLFSLSKGEEKGEWERRIVNTSLPCIAVPSPEVKRIINEIFKGNYLSYIDLWIWNNFTETTIIGGLICKIKDFNLFKKYLSIYAKKCDNWATCDSLKYQINKNNQDNFFDLAIEYCNKTLTYEKRIGLTMLFKFVDNDHIDKILEICNNYEKETEYYVLMALAWLVAECFIKQRSKTLEYIKDNSLNKFTQNKAISKIRDSFRVSNNDKEMLIKYKK